MAFDIDIVFNGVIGLCFLAITASILYGAFTSHVQFFRYVGPVYASFIGTCGLARFARLAAYLLRLSRVRYIMVVDVTDGLSAIVGLSAAIAIVAITIVMTRLPKRVQ